MNLSTALKLVVVMGVTATTSVAIAQTRGTAGRRAALPTPPAEPVVVTPAPVPAPQPVARVTVVETLVPVFDPFTLQPAAPAAAVLLPAAASPTAAVALAVRPPYRPPSRSPYRPPGRGPYFP